MNSKKDITSLIKENEHKLATPPRPEAWRKLEKKLDNRRSRHRVRFIGPLSMVAGVSAIITVVTVMSLLGTKEEQKMDSATPSYVAAFEMQEIPETEAIAERQDRKKVVEYINSFKSRGEMPIDEGDQEDELISGD